MSETTDKKKKNKKASKKDLAQVVLDQGWASDLKHAASLILAGEVFVNEQKITHAGFKINDEDHIRVKERSRFVGRGGEKLFGVIEHFHLKESFLQKSALDIGSSTGGFTDCMLSLGLTHAICVDVGTNQLAWKLRQDTRVSVFEKTDVRTMPWDFLGDRQLDWVVVDVSFISVRFVLESLMDRCPGLRNCQALVLFKPQFEVDSSQVPEGGVVRDTQQIDDACMRFQSWLSQRKEVSQVQMTKSKVKGRDGNQEYFFFFKWNVRGL